MVEQKRYWECVKDFVMDDGEITHRCGNIYPSTKKSYHQIGMSSADSSMFEHEMDTRESYFTECFREIESIKIKEVLREKKYVEEYMEKLDVIDEDETDFIMHSIRFFSDGSGFIYKGEDYDEALDFNNLDDLDKQLAKIVAQ